MPLFLLYVWEGGRKYSYYDLLTVTEPEWEEWDCLLQFTSRTHTLARMKRSKVQYDDRVIEARWDLKRGAWRLMRLRDDKPDGNHRDVVEKVVQTILDPVRESDVSNVQLTSLERNSKYIMHSWLQDVPAFALIGKPVQRRVVLVHLQTSDLPFAFPLTTSHRQISRSPVHLTGKGHLWAMAFQKYPAPPWSMGGTDEGNPYHCARL